MTTSLPPELPRIKNCMAYPNVPYMQWEFIGDWLSLERARAITGLQKKWYNDTLALLHKPKTPINRLKVVPI